MTSNLVVLDVIVALGLLAIPARFSLSARVVLSSDLLMFGDGERLVAHHLDGLHAALVAALLAALRAAPLGRLLRRLLRRLRRRPRVPVHLAGHAHLLGRRLARAADHLVV